MSAYGGAVYGGAVYGTGGPPGPTTYTADATFTTAAGVVKYTNDLVFTTPPGGAPLVPAAPTNLVAVLVGATRIDLSWQDNSADESGFVVERSVNAGAFTQRASLPPDTFGFADTPLAAGTAYTYRVLAFNNAGSSGYSNTAGQSTPAPAVPAAPTGLVVTQVGEAQVGLQWADNANNELAYEVERSAVGAGGPFGLVAVLGPDAVAHTDATVGPGTPYWYRVRATNAQGPSGYSNTVAVTTVALPPTPAPNEAPVGARMLVYVDWNNDGDFEDALEDVTDDVLATVPVQMVRGRDQLQALAPPMAGSATSTLDNDARTYSPQYAGGPLYGSLLPGRRVRYEGERPGTTAAYPAVVLADAPLAYWRLGETAGTAVADASGNGRTGSYSGGPALNQPGAVVGDADGAVGLDGADDYAAVPDHPTFGTAAVTAEAWVYLTAPVGNGVGSLLNRRTTGNVGGFTLEVTNLNGGAVVFFAYVGGAWRSVVGRALALRRWYHVAGTYDGTTLRLYYDGELDAQSTPAAPGPLNDPAGAVVQLGRNVAFGGTPGAGGFLAARLDEAALYGTALTTERVREHYVAGRAGRVRLFTGVLDDLPQHPGYEEKTVDLPALGSLSRLRGTKVSTGLYQNVRVDQALAVLLDAAGWPAADRRIGAGNTTLTWWWLDDRDAFTAAVELVNTEGPGAALYEDGDGYVVFEGRYHRLTSSRSLLPQAVFAGDGTEPYHLDDLGYNPNLKGVFNACSVEIRQRAATALEVVWTLGAPFSLGAGESRPFKVGAADGSPLTGALTPVAGTDYTLSSGSLASVALNRSSGGNVTVFVTAGASGAALTGLQLRAQRVPVVRTYREVHRVDTSASVAAHGERTFDLALWPEVDPLVAQDFCDAVVTAYQQPRASLSLWVPAYAGGYTADRALSLRVSDRVVVQDSQTGLSGEAMVEQVEYVNRSPDEFLARFGCEQVSNAATNYLVWDSGAWDVDRWAY